MRKLALRSPIDDRWLRPVRPIGKPLVHCEITFVTNKTLRACFSRFQFGRPFVCKREETEPANVKTTPANKTHSHVLQTRTNGGPRRHVKQTSNSQTRKTHSQRLFVTKQSLINITRIMCGLGPNGIVSCACCQSPAK